MRKQFKSSLLQSKESVRCDTEITEGRRSRQDRSKVRKAETIMEQIAQERKHVASPQYQKAVSQLAATTASFAKPSLKLRTIEESSYATVKQPLRSKTPLGTTLKITPDITRSTTPVVQRTNKKTKPKPRYNFTCQADKDALNDVYAKCTVQTLDELNRLKKPSK